MLAGLWISENGLGNCKDRYSADLALLFFIFLITGKWTDYYFAVADLKDLFPHFPHFDPGLDAVLNSYILNTTANS